MQWSRSPGKTGSHFDPSSDLFVPSERKDVITSTVCWTAMAALLVGLGFVMGPMQLLKLYGVPYWVNPVSLIFILVYAMEIENEFFFSNGWVLKPDFASFLGFCYVAGLSHLPASSWSWRKITMVSWKGMVFKVVCHFICVHLFSSYIEVWKYEKIR